ncbi:MAG: hypothetical protein J6S63_09725 [Atopobiaceae bacterium]|nr:hypothetical protein [Atopobiaceae bacterium]
MASVTAPSALHDLLTGLFRSGERTDAHTQLLGLEVEHFIVALNGRPLSYEAPSGDIGARDILEHLTSAFPRRMSDGNGNLLGVAGPTGSVTLEAGSQLEYSVAPYARVEHIEKAYAKFRSLVDPYVLGHGYRLETWGYHPTRRADELGLTPEERYAFLDAHFSDGQSSGRHTMRAMAATQVSVDYTSERDAVRKLRVASALAPVLAAIADNSPVFDGRPNHTPIRRLMVWRNVGNRRGGIAPRLFSHGFCYGTYADWLVQTSPIYTPARAESTSKACAQSAQEAYAHTRPSQQDAEHVASVVWPDARLKRIVEIRPADCMPADCVMGYAALIKGLLYPERSLAAIERALGVHEDVWPLTDQDVDDAIEQIQERGGLGMVYGMPLHEWEELLFSLAYLALDEGDRRYLAPLEAFAADKHWWRVS